MVYRINKDQADTARTNYCKTLPKSRFRVNLDDRGAIKYRRILGVLPNPNTEQGCIY